MRARSTPASLARRRASGEEKMRLPPIPIVRAPSPPAFPGRGEGAAGVCAELRYLSTSICEENLFCGDELGATPSSRGGGWDEGVPPLSVLAAVTPGFTAAAVLPAFAAAALMSSPSSASTAI